MKIIVSHDVDHLYWKDHWFRDLYIPKMFALTAKQWLSGVLQFDKFIQRVNFLKESRINRIDELIDFENQLGFKSTFFFGMSNALGLSYKVEEVKPLILSLKEKGFGVGVHGINFSDKEAMTEEFLAFKSIVNTEFGIRMHYLRNNESTFNLMSETGYAFDTTIYEVNAPYRIGNMWEIPLTIMDVYAVRPDHTDVSIAKRYSMDILQQAEQKQIPYFVVNFHDPYFSNAYSIYKDWFIWIIELLKARGYEFITYSEALRELQNR